MKIVQDYFEPQVDKISDAICKNWTKQALECYSIKCDCSKCSIKTENYSFVCQMPKVLDMIIKEKGLPSKIKRAS